MFSVDGLRRQLDDSSAQRDQFEKIQLNVSEELRGVRNRLEADSSNLNALTNELRQRTRKLDDDQRLMVKISFFNKINFIESNRFRMI